MTRRKRRTFTAEDKLNAVKRHLIDKVPISDLCDELGLQPTQIYQWQKLLFDNGGSAFDKPGRKAKQDDAKDRQIARKKRKKGTGKFLRGGCIVSLPICASVAFVFKSTSYDEMLRFAQYSTTASCIDV